MSWNFDETVNREGTWCVKYDLRKEIFGEADIIPMWVADMDFNTPPFIVSAIKERAGHEVYGYSFRPQVYYSSIADWLSKQYKWQISTDWICFSPGIVPALNFCTLAFTEPGDGIIVQPPVYFPFFSAIESHGRKLLYNRLVNTGKRWEMDVRSLHQPQFENAKAIFISNPHNPVGRSWSKEELTELCEFCLKRNILIISDEIHSDLTLPGYMHTPVATLGEEIAEITITLTAPSKTFNIAGLATSSVIISNPLLIKRFLTLTESLHVGNGNIFGITASIAAYTSGYEWLQDLIRYIDKNVSFAIDFINKNIPGISAVKPEATYMLWLDCTGLQMGVKELQSLFIKNARVGLNEGSTFGPGGEGFMRMNVATSMTNVEQALEQIAKAVSDLKK